MENAFIYIITNLRNTVLYTGSTNSLKKRINHHKKKLVSGFSKKYNLEKLVYVEKFNNMDLARRREAQIKKGSRNRKILLIEKMNPHWTDLYYQLE